MGLPGVIRAQFEQAGVQPAARHYVLDVGNTPQRDMGMGKALLIVGGGIALVAAGIGWFKRRRQRLRLQ